MKKYDKDFKKETVKKFLDGQSVASISREIGVNENTIHSAVGRMYDNSKEHLRLQNYREDLYWVKLKRSLSFAHVNIT
ncbi:hypothetical protein BH20ACI4_BH20ACI4_13960 [soil metagenome]